MKLWNVHYSINEKSFLYAIFWECRWIENVIWKLPTPSKSVKNVNSVTRCQRWTLNWTFGVDRLITKSNEVGHLRKISVCIRCKKTHFQFWISLINSVETNAQHYMAKWKWSSVRNASAFRIQKFASMLKMSHQNYFKVCF